MRNHHILMLERDADGEIVAGHEVPNNEWARCRRKGWDFATAEEILAYQQMQVDAAADKAARMSDSTPAKEESKTDAGTITPTSGGYYEVTVGGITEKIQGRNKAEELLAEMEAAATATA